MRTWLLGSESGQQSTDGASLVSLETSSSSRCRRRWHTKRLCTSICRSVQHGSGEPDSLFLPGGTCMTELCFVDTNVLVYARDRTEPEKQRRAEEWMQTLWRTRQGRLSIQVLQEYYAIVVHKLRPGLKKEAARERCSGAYDVAACADKSSRD